MRTQDRFRIFRKQIAPDMQKAQALDALIKASKELLQHYHDDDCALDLLEDVQRWAIREMINTLE